MIEVLALFSSCIFVSFLTGKGLVTSSKLTEWFWGAWASCLVLKNHSKPGGVSSVLENVYGVRGEVRLGLVKNVMFEAL